jgi:hypothetical protein
VDPYAAPYWVVLGMLGAAAMVAACSAHILFRRLVPYNKLVAHNDVAGFMIAVIGVIYAVLIAFVVIVVWQQYNDSDSRYGDEVAAMADLDGYARTLPEPQRTTVRTMVRHYIRLMIDDEWPAMRFGGESGAASQVLSDLANAIEAPHPSAYRSALIQDQMVRALRTAADDRQRRLSDNQNTLPQVMWTALLAGAVVTVGFGFLFGVANFRVQLAMTASVAMLIALSFTLLIELDFPFRRDAAIGADRWQYLQHTLGRAGSGAQAALTIAAAPARR